MIIRGKLHAESPVYRGNGRKTLFTRDGDGSHRLVSLAGEISGTAQSLMDAFIGQSKNGRNLGLLNQLWLRMYGAGLPKNLISKVECKLQKEYYPKGNFFDLRMGIKLDEDRWAAEANANYKMETLFRNAVFDLVLTVNDSQLKQDNNAARLYYVLQELIEGRFWFGAGKSKGLGRLRLEMKIPFAAPEAPPKMHSYTNHLQVNLSFDATNPVLVGWNWGKVDPETPSFAAVEGHLLVGSMRDLPVPVRERLEMRLGGPILNAEDWKKKLAEYLPRTIAILLQEHSKREIEILALPAAGLAKMGKGKHGLSKKVIAGLEPLVGRPFFSLAEAEAAVSEALADKANMTKRVMKAMKKETQVEHGLDEDLWEEIANSLGLDVALSDQLFADIGDEAALTKVLSTACQSILPRLYQQVDQQINLLQSDAWVDAEIANREEHLLIKVKLHEGKIRESQWGDSRQVPDGVSAAAWREFLDSHRRVRFHHLLNDRNLRKSITNDRNFIAFLKHYRNRTRQELVQPHHLDFRPGGPSKRDVSRRHGKPYDTVFMRMLSWSPSARETGAWEVYIPGGTIKGAFRKRATQILKTLWGETGKTNNLLNKLFGAQRKRGLVFFSDAYLRDPADPNKLWCSMDGVKMDPKTGKPIETAKHDYLYAYGNKLAFQFQLDIQDVSEDDLDALSLLAHLLQDFKRGDIPIGGEKTSGFGWVKGNVSSLNWLTASPTGVSQTLFENAALTEEGVWHRLNLEGEAAAQSLQAAQVPLTAAQEITQSPPTAKEGFISHRAFGGYCGMLTVEAETLTPLSIRESGQPSFTTTLEDGPVNGWDFFSMSPPEASHRSDDRVYALPSKSIRGMIRHIYAIAGDARGESPNINNLNPVDSLFGWVGRGQNQAIMGRVSFGFGLFDNPELAWFKVPYPYGEWQYNNGKWNRVPDSSAAKLVIKNTWRIFPHAPLAPAATQLNGFEADTFQADYFRAILPGQKTRFTVRFWNLEKLELERLVWALTLEPDLAHKMGQDRYLGFGSLRLRILPNSYLIDWGARYAGGSEQSWQLPFNVDEWLNPKRVHHHAQLQKALNVNGL